MLKRSFDTWIIQQREERAVPELILLIDSHSLASGLSGEVVAAFDERAVDKMQAKSGEKLIWILTTSQRLVL